MTERTIPNDVLATLSAGRCDGVRYFLPTGQLDRKHYEAVNKVLDALGGKWNRSAKAHVFADDCTDILESASESGTYARPADMGWFPTPADLAEQIVAMADVSPGMTFLEPSAGMGAIVKAIRQTKPKHILAVEIDAKRAASLIEADAVMESDFLSVPPNPEFDRVCMNPPFAKRADIHHVRHARKFLKPDGLLVSIMSAGIAFRDDALSKAFRNECESIEALPDGSFKESGTGVRTVVVTMRAE